MLVDADEAAGAVEVEFFEAPAFRARPAADGDEHLVRGDPLLLAGDLHRQCLARIALRLRAGQHAHAEFAETLGDGLDEFAIVLRQDLRHRLDHRHPRAELGEGGAELQPDIAATDDG